MGEIDQLKLELEEDEKEFVKQEKKLIQELNKYEVIFILHLRITLDYYVRETEMILHAIMID